MPPSSRIESLVAETRGKIYFTLTIFFIGLVLTPLVQAHAPLGTGGNENLASATIVPDPTKSWAIYAELHEGKETQYYQFNIAQGQRIHISLFTTTSLEDADFIPIMVLMGPRIVTQGVIPSYVQIPSNLGAIAVNGIRATQATYEPFAPSAFVELAEISIIAPANGTYYVAVHDPIRGGNYGLAIGDRESFTVSEWLLTPFSLLSVYHWERQSLPIILVPAIAIVAIGFILIVWRQLAGKVFDMPGWIASIAGLLFIGTGGIVFSQMAFALSQSSLDAFVIVTLIFAFSPFILGFVTLHFAFRYTGHWDLRTRIYLIILGGLALVIWTGYVIGPILAIAAAVLPTMADSTSKQDGKA